MEQKQKALAFEQLPELIQNLVERIEALEKTVREKHQPLPLEGELMSVEDLCKLLGKSKSAVYRTVRYRDIPYIRQGNRLYFDRATIKKWLEYLDKSMKSSIFVPTNIFTALRQQKLDTLWKWENTENGQSALLMEGIRRLGIIKITNPKKQTST